MSSISVVVLASALLCAAAADVCAQSDSLYSEAVRVFSQGTVAKQLNW